MTFDQAARSTLLAMGHIYAQICMHTHMDFRNNLNYNIALQLLFASDSILCPILSHYREDLNSNSTIVSHTNFSDDMANLNA